MFHQVLNPAGNLALTWLVALVPVVALLVLLAVFRVSAWLSTLIGSVICSIILPIAARLFADRGSSRRFSDRRQRSIEILVRRVALANPKE